MKYWNSIIVKVLLITTVSFCILIPRSQAQTFGEWFQQDKTQKKYLLAQIAALQVYLDYIKKGFTICHDGLTLIHDVKNGEFNLHSLFYSSLKTVSPPVLRYARVADIIANHTYILAHYKDILAAANSSGQFSTGERALFAKCFSNLVDEVNSTLEDLATTTTDNQVQMTDDERMRRIDRLFEQSMAQRASLHQMNIDIQQIAQTRLKETAELNSLSSQTSIP